MSSNSQTIPEFEDATHTNLLNRINEITARRSNPDLTNDVRMLVKIGEDISAIPNPDRRGSNWKAARSTKTVLWLNLLDCIDRLRVADFDFTDLPTTYVAPPGGAYDAGVDPSVIADPSVRKQYEDAIRKNAEKATRYNYQYDLKLIDERLTARAVKYLADSYSRDPADKTELTEQVETLLSSRARQDEMKKRLGVGF